MDPSLRQLLDRQEILDCIHRYCRGIDRNDLALAQSAFHDDALEDHGAFKGRSHDLPNWVEGLIAESWSGFLHTISNHYAELDGDSAHAETYFTAYMVWKDGSAVDVAIGRYIDRFERRDGKWAIAGRTVVREGSGLITTPAAPANSSVASHHYQPSRRDTQDVSYERPLVINLPTSPA